MMPYVMLYKDNKKTLFIVIVIASHQFDVFIGDDEFRKQYIFYIARDLANLGVQNFIKA